MKKLLVVLFAVPIICTAQSSEERAVEAFSKVRTYASQNNHAIPQVLSFINQYDTLKCEDTIETKGARVDVYHIEIKKGAQFSMNPLPCVILPELGKPVAYNLYQNILTLVIDSACIVDQSVNIVGAEIVFASTLQYYSTNIDTSLFENAKVKQEVFEGTMIVANLNAYNFAIEFLEHRSGGYEQLSPAEKDRHKFFAQGKHKYMDMLRKASAVVQKD